MSENTNGRALALSPSQAPLAAKLEMDRERMALLSRTLGANLHRDELHLFLAVAARLGLDPFTRQIHAIKDKQGRFYLHVGIDGRRAIAQRTGLVDGTLGPFWCGPDGEWKDVWLADDAPAAARFGVLKKGCREPFWGVARLRSFRGTGPNWDNRADHQLAKVAEDHAWRKAFPFEMGGIPTPYQPEHDEQQDEEPEAEYREIDHDSGEITETPRGPAGPASARHPVAAATEQRAAEGATSRPAPDQPQGPRDPTENSHDAPPDAPPEELDRTLAEHAAAVGERARAAVAETGRLPAWVGTPIGGRVSSMLDQLTEAGIRFQLPADDATDEDLEAWIAAKRKLLQQRQAAK